MKYICIFLASAEAGQKNEIFTLNMNVIHCVNIVYLPCSYIFHQHLAWSVKTANVHWS